MRGAPWGCEKGAMCRRMEEVKRNEQRATVEDLMYASVLEKFVEVGVDMMPTLDSITESQETLKVGPNALLGRIAGGVTSMRSWQQMRTSMHALIASSKSWTSLCTRSRWCSISVL